MIPELNTCFVLNANESGEWESVSSKSAGRSGGVVSASIWMSCALVKQEAVVFWTDSISSSHPHDLNHS